MLFRFLGLRALAALARDRAVAAIAVLTAPAMWSFKHCPARHNQVSGTAPAALLCSLVCSRRARTARRERERFHSLARRSRPTRRRSAHPSPSWS